MLDFLVCNSRTISATINCVYVHCCLCVNWVRLFSLIVLCLLFSYTRLYQHYCLTFWIIVPFRLIVQCIIGITVMYEVFGVINWPVCVTFNCPAAIVSVYFIENI